MVEVIGLIALQAVGAGGLTLFGLSAAATASLVGSLILGVALIGLQFALRPGLPKQNDQVQATKQEIPPRIYGYGRTRIGGAYMLYHAKNNVSIDVVAMCGRKVSGFVGFYLHDDPVVLNDSGTVTSTPEHADDRRYKEGFVNIQTRLGLPTETAYADVVSYLPNVWSNDHRGDGTASLRLRCERVNQKNFLAIYPRGLPVPSAVIDLMPIWDPRDEDQDPEDPDTWTDYPEWDETETYAAGDRVLHRGVAFYSYSGGNTGNAPDESPDGWCSVWQNPVLQLIDFMVNADYGMALDRAVTIDPVLPELMAEADLCDELVADKVLDLAPRYRSNGWATYETDPKEVVGAILATCDGWMTFDGNGGLIVTVGVYRAPDGPVLRDHHVIDLFTEAGQADERAANELKLAFVSPDHKYKEVPGAALRDEEDISSRGRVRSQSLQLTWVHHHPQARRLQKRQFQRMNARLRGRLTTHLFGEVLMGQRWVRVNLTAFGVPDLEDAVIEIVSAPETDWLEGRCQFDWIIVNPNTIDAWDPATEEGAMPPVPAEGDGGGPPVPFDVSGALRASEGAFVIDVSFDDNGRNDLDYAIRYRVTDDGLGNPGPWQETAPAQGKEAAGRITVSTPVVAGGYSYIVQVASVGGGQFSEWSASDTVDALDPTAPDPVTSLSLTGGAGQIAATWTAPNSANFIGTRVYWNTTNSMTGATLFTTRYGAPLASQAATVTGLTAGTRWILVRAINGSGVESTVVSSSATVT